MTEHRKLYLREWNRRRRTGRLARGLCAKCDTPRTTHAYYCEHHAAYNRTMTRAYVRKSIDPKKIARLEKLRLARLCPPNPLPSRSKTVSSTSTTRR